MVYDVTPVVCEVPETLSLLNTVVLTSWDKSSFSMGVSGAARALEQGGGATHDQGTGAFCGSWAQGVT